MTRPLDGLIVVALEQAVAAPFCTMRLADAGARVIKLERPEGDFARGYDDVAVGQSSYFVWLNRGKESVVVDLRRESDRALFLAFGSDRVRACLDHRWTVGSGSSWFFHCRHSHGRRGSTGNP